MGQYAFETVITDFALDLIWLWFKDAKSSRENLYGDNIWS